VEGNKRIYPAARFMDGWFKILLLAFSAMVILSGLWKQDENSLFSIRPSAVSTPVPLEEAFDETMAERTVTLPSSVWYALQLGSFDTEEEAKAVADTYRRRGAAGFLWNDGRWRVLAAVYPLREDAQSVRLQLEAGHDVESVLYQLAFPQLELRVNGMAGQLEILEAAFVHADALTTQLHQISIAMDRQEMTAAEAAEALQALGAQLELVALRMEQRFTTPRHQTVTGLIRLFRDSAEFGRAFSPDADGVTAGMQIKHQNLSVLYQLQQIYAALSHT